MQGMKDWDSLKIILTVARERGLSGAARHLNINHATVSRRIARAEADCGHLLFDRLPSGLVLTQAGQRFIEHAEIMEQEVLALDMTLAAWAQGARSLAVTVPPLMADINFSKDVSVFKADHPQVNISLLGDNKALNLHRREADVAIRVSDRPPESLWGRVIAKQRAAWFATQDFIHEYQDVLDGSSDRSIPYIEFTTWKSPKPKALEREYPNAKSVLTSDDMIAAISAVRAGIGMTRMPHFIGAGDVGLIRINQLPLESYPPIWILTHPDLKQNKIVRHFMTFMSDRFAGRKMKYWGSDQ